MHGFFVPPLSAKGKDVVQPSVSVDCGRLDYKHRHLVKVKGQLAVFTHHSCVVGTL